MAIEIIRTDPKNVGYHCELCGTEAAKRPQWKTHARYLFVPESGSDRIPEELVLCPLHEHELMEKIVNNWAKRKARNGFPRANPCRKEKESAVGSETNDASA